MNHEASSDHGTVLRPDQSALVINDDGSFGLLLPSVPDAAPATVGQSLLVAIAVCMNDPEWINAMLAVLGEAHQDLAKEEVRH